ncbi:NERD domain-containing protein [Nocardia nova]|nr:NERD domain-containing protein [Nocardia nova]
MLIVNDTPLRPLSEKRAEEWLRSPADGRSRPGVAIADCHVAKPGKSWTQQVDFIVITLHAVLVLEIKGTHPSLTDGCVIADPNDRWRHDLTDIDPVRTRASDRNPLAQALDAAYQLKSLTSKHNPDHPFVHAVVVLVPPTNSTLTLQASAMPRGTAVVLGETGLRSAVDISRRTRPIWTAEQVYSMMNALGFGDLITIGALIGEGFPALDRNHAAWLPPTLAPSPAAAHRPRTEFFQRPTRIPAAQATPQRPRTGAPAGPSRPYLSRTDRRVRQAIAIAIIVSFMLTIWWIIVHFQPNPHRPPEPSRPAPAAFDTRSSTSLRFGGTPYAAASGLSATTRQDA